MTMLMEAPVHGEQAVPFAARGLTAFPQGNPFPDGMRLCPDRQVNVLPDGTVAATDNDLMMTTGCWGTTAPNGRSDWHGDD